MNENIRQKLLVELIESKGFMSTLDIINYFSISPATARRDLTKLANEKRIKKVRNGAEPIENLIQYQKWSPLNLTNDINFEEKQKIAFKASELCKDEENIIINCGSTAFLLGRELCHRNLSIITNYFPLACYLIENEHENVIIMGGLYNKKQNIIINPMIQNDETYCAKWMFTSGKTLTPAGLYKTEILTAVSEQQILKNAEKVVVVVDSSKLSMTAEGGMLFCTLSSIDLVITGKNADPNVVALIKEAGIEVQLV